MEILIVLIIAVVIIAWKGVKIVPQSQVFMIERLGKFHREAETGLHVIIPFFDRVRAVVDLREQVQDFPPQAVITKDNVGMTVDSVVYYQVTNPFDYTYKVENAETAIANLSATTLRNIIGEMELDETLSSRDSINKTLSQTLDEVTDRWGIKVNQVELKDVNPPEDVRRAMEKQVSAEREKREQILLAEGKKESAILEAEGKRESEIKEAEGEAQAFLEVQRARGEGLKLLYEAIKAADVDDRVIQLQALEAIQQLSQGEANKIFFPSDVTEILGSVGAVQSLLNEGAAPDA